MTPHAFVYFVAKKADAGADRWRLAVYTLAHVHINIGVVPRVTRPVASEWRLSAVACRAGGRVSPRAARERTRQPPYFI